jgi:hypothetical protein
LIELEEARDRAAAVLQSTPQYRHQGREPIENPEWKPKYSAYEAAKKAYDDHRASMIAGAKKAAQESMEKKYLDAVSGTIKGSLQVFDGDIPINIESDKGTLYVELSTKVTDELKKVIGSLIGTTVDMPFWKSEHMKAIGKGMQRWWHVFSPTAVADVDSIANGYALGVVLNVLKDMAMSPGVLKNDKTLFGLNLDIDSYALLNLISEVTAWDEIGIGLCEVKYKHPAKDNFYSLYGMLEYLNYVSPTLTSASGKADMERLEQLANGVYKTKGEVDEMGMADAVKELVLFIRSNLMREVKRLKEGLLKNIKGVNVTADVSLRPQEVINALLAERKQGSFTFKDKDKSTIENVHVQGDYENTGVPKGTGSIGAGPKGEQNLVIPGATYLTESKDAKVSYDSIELAPVAIGYENDVYSIKSQSATIDGFKFGVKKK